MAIPITQRLSSLANQISKTPQLILEIEGIDGTFSTSAVFELSSWDNVQLFWDDGVTFWDGTSPKSDNRQLIDWNGTDTTLSQQIRPDRSSTQSVPTFRVRIIDKNNQIAQEFSFDNINEQLSKKVNMYVSLQGAVHRQDSIPIIFGYLDEFEFGPGYVQLSISHASNLQRQSIFTQTTTELTSDIDNSTNLIPVEDTDGYYLAQDAVKTFIQIDDEIMQITGINPNSFIVVRGALNTQIVSHDSGADVLAYFTLTGKPLDLYQKILLSNPGNTFTSIGFSLKSVNVASSTITVNNSFIFESENVAEFAGIIPGDTINYTGSLVNDGNYTVLNSGILDTGDSFITVEEDLSDEIVAQGVATLRSQYNVLPDGLGLEPREVDANGMTQEAQDFDAEFFDYIDLPIKETVEDAKDFLEKQILYSQNCYSIPRKARVSAKFTRPPLSVDITPTLNTSNVQNPGNLKIKRSTHKYYYNSVRYNYNLSYVEDKFFRTLTFFDAESTSRINIGNSTLTIPSDGIRQESNTVDNLTRLSSRLLQRYRFAAAEIRNIQVLFKDSINLEVGDIIPFGGSDTQLADPQTGRRDLPVALYEIINKKLSIRDGRVVLDLIESGFGLQGVRGTIAPSSQVAQATLNSVTIETLNGSTRYLDERDKYEDFINTALRVYTEDYSFDETVNIVGFPDGQPNTILVSPDFSSVPIQGAVVEFATYSNQPINNQTNLLKIKHVFLMYQATIVSAVSSSEFDVDDASDLFEGQVISIHAPDYSSDSFTNLTTINTIIGNTITITDAVTFPLLNGYLVETYSFSDGRDGYVLL